MFKCYPLPTLVTHAERLDNFLRQPHADIFQTFPREHHLKTHQASKSCVQNCTYFCPNCQSGFIAEEKLKIHLRVNRPLLYLTFFDSIHVENLSEMA